jgi:hypothetical protein
MSHFNAWVEADDAWHALAEAFLRSGEPEKARGALDRIEAGLNEFKTLLAQASAQDSGVIKGQRKTMADKLAQLEARYTVARASIR